MTPSLSETFEPPSTTTYGRSGFSVALAQRLDLGRAPARPRRAAAAARRRRRTPACGAPRRSRRTRRRRPARRARRPARRARRRPWRSRARRTGCSPAARSRRPRAPATVALADSPTTSSASATGRAEQLAEAGGDRGEGVLGVRLALGAAQVRRDDHAGARRRAASSASGAAARMRPSSVMVVPSSGTLKSERTSTRLPRRSPRSVDGLHGSSSGRDRSRGVARDDVRVPARRGGGARGRRHERLLGMIRDARPRTTVEVDEAVGVAPLVVVPGDDLDLVADHLGEAGVEDARGRVGDDVGGDDRVLGVLEDALELRPSAAALIAALTSSTVTSGEAVKVRSVAEPVGIGTRMRVAVELALELREHEGDGLGGTGRRRDDVDARRHGRGAGPCAGRPAGSGPACTRGSWS